MRAASSRRQGYFCDAKNRERGTGLAPTAPLARCGQGPLWCFLASHSKQAPSRQHPSPAVAIARRRRIPPCTECFHRHSSTIRGHGMRPWCAYGMSSGGSRQSRSPGGRQGEVDQVIQRGPHRRSWGAPRERRSFRGRAAAPARAARRSAAPAARAPRAQSSAAACCPAPSRPEPAAGSEATRPAGTSGEARRAHPA